MAFRYRRQDRNVARATRRLARRRSAHALKALGGGEPPAQALHTARKDAKKLRALLKLIRPAFAGYKAENAALRDAARAVSTLRDRGAMLEAFDRVAPGPAAADFAHVRAALEAREPAALDARAEVMALAETFAGFRRRSRGWRLGRKGFAALEGGLADGYARARLAMQAARRTGSAEAFHQWRKCAKAHWYQTTLLARIAPDKTAPHVALAGDLAERLGDHHDLVTLAALLPALDLPEPERAAFAALVETQRRGLEQRAFSLGHAVFADSPKRFVKRWRKWWKRRKR